MARNLEFYRFREGVTPLSEKELNARFFDLDVRLNVLEQLQISWEASVAALNNLGIEKMNALISPIITEANSVLEDLNELRGDLEEWFGSGTIGGDVVVFEPPAGMTATNVQDALEELDARATALSGSLASLTDRVASIEAWQTTHTHTQSQITDLSHDAVKIRGRNVSTAVPTNNQALSWDSANAAWIPKTLEGGVGSGLAVFTSSGSFTVPTSTVIVEVVGGGGGGGRSTYNQCGCGGGAGGYSKKIVTGLTPGNVIPVTVGAGGAKATGSGTSGSAGGTSSFGAYVSAAGGSGGSTSVTGAVTGGAGSGGNINITGGYGKSRYSADSTIYGTNYYSTSEGGNSQMGQGGMKSTSGGAHNPTGYGAGGYGSTSDVAAADGTPGIVIVHY